MVGTPLTPASGADYEPISSNLRPLWTVKDLQDEKTVLKWMRESRNICEEFYAPVFDVQMDNLLIYKGNQWQNQERTTNRYLDRSGVATRSSPKVVVNDISDYVEQWVSRLTRFKPTVAINPANPEWSDVQDSKVSKAVLDHIWYIRLVDQKFQELCRQSKVFGESYMWILWNPNLGDLTPAQAQARANGTRIPLTNEAGEPVKDSEGKDIYVEASVRIGDVDYQIDAPWHVWDMPCRNRDHIDWCIRWKLVDVDTLKAQYPEQASKINCDNQSELFDRYRIDLTKLRNEVVVYELYHRSTEFLDKGAYIKCTDSCLLESGDLPYNHGQIPYVRLTDIDVPDEIRGMSFIQNVFPLAFQKNALMSLIYKSAVLAAHPKWVVPAGAVEFQQLANQTTVLSYEGGVPPHLANSNSLPMELFTHLKVISENEDKLAGVYAMSRGEVPAGVRAGAALRVLEEQEDKRSYIANTKFNQAVIETARMTLAVAGDYYDEDDGRLARVVGKGNEYLIKSFESANLSKSYDIRIQNTSALSQSPSGRIQDILDLSQMQVMGENGQPQGGFWTKAEVVDALDLGANDKMRDLATEAIRCAESENDDILDGQEVGDPSPTEDLIAHWRVHRRPMQNRTFKTLTPPEFRQALEAHFLATEYLMYTKALTNPGFAQKLLNEPDFPCLFNPEVLVTPQDPAMVGGTTAGTVEEDPALQDPRMDSQPMPEGQALEAASPSAPATPAEEQPAPL